MKLAIDTNRYSDLDRGVAGVADVLLAASEIYIPFVVLAELHIGFRRGTKQAANEDRLNQFLKQPGIFPLWPDADTVDNFAAISVQLQRQGTPIPIHDIWIAALCLQHDLSLYARDKHFDHLPQLSRI